MSLKRKLFCLTADQKKKDICIYDSNNSNKSQQDIANVLLQSLIFKTCAVAVCMTWHVLSTGTPTMWSPVIPPTSPLTRNILLTECGEITRLDCICQVALVWPPRNTCFLGLTQVQIPNDISIGSAAFAPTHSRELLYFTMSHPFSVLKLLIPMGDLDRHLIHSSFSQPDFSTQTASQLVQPFWQGSLLWQIDRPTDRPSYSVCNNRLCLLQCA